MRDRYAELVREFRWQVPGRFNIARACCGQWAEDPSRTALHWEDESGAASTWSFRDIQAAANRLSNALAALGVGRGDRVALILPQRPETAIAYMAIFQMGAIALLLDERYRGKLPLFGGIDKARFRRQVGPGDCLDLEVRLGRLSARAGTGTGTASVDGAVACEASLLFVIADA